MAKFNGKNSIRSASRLGGARALYNSQAFPSNTPQVVNFNFAEKTLYGRVDQAFNPVVAQAKFMVPTFEQSGEGPAVLLMNFVADQFADFMLHFSRACRLGSLPADDPVFSSIQAKRGFISSNLIYDEYSDNIMGLYANQFLDQYSVNIKNFNDYLDSFPQFMNIMRDIFPVTYSGFQRSNQSSIFTSGLAVDIAGIPFGDDAAKERLILNSPSFTFYLNLAKQYGFSVDKRNPGVMVSDLASPVTAKYRSKYGLPTIQSVFLKQYSRALEQDIPEFISLLVNGYNSYVTNNRIDRTFSICDNNKLQSRIRHREYININNIDSIYYNNILKTYVISRNIEERKPFSDNRVTAIINEAFVIKKFSIDKMLEFIDKQFRDEYNLKRGSLTYYKKKLEKKLDK